MTKPYTSSRPASKGSTLLPAAQTADSKPTIRWPVLEGHHAD